MTDHKRFYQIFFAVFVVCTYALPAVCFVMFGALFIYLGWTGMKMSIKLGRTGLVVPAEIIELPGAFSRYNSPTVSFTPPGSEPITGKPGIFTASFLKSSDTYKESNGTKLMIVYDPDNPRDFLMAEGRELYLPLSIVIFGAGAVSGVAGMLFLTGKMQMHS